MHIVHVDDDPEYAGLVEAILTGLGFPVSQAETVGEAWERIASTERVLVLCDQRLPDGTGLDLLKRIRDAGRRDHFVLMSGMCSDQLKREAIAQGANEVVEKPMSLAELERGLAAVVETATSHLGRRSQADDIAHVRVD